jgi:hypothetical protein
LHDNPGPEGQFHCLRHPPDNAEAADHEIDHENRRRPDLINPLGTERTRGILPTRIPIPSDEKQRPKANSSQGISRFLKTNFPELLDVNVPWMAI